MKTMVRIEGYEIDPLSGMIISGEARVGDRRFRLRYRSYKVIEVMYVTFEPIEGYNHVKGRVDHFKTTTSRDRDLSIEDNLKKAVNECNSLVGDYEKNRLK